MLAGVVRAALERRLAAELTEHLGYDRGIRTRRRSARNGTSSKTMLEVGGCGSGRSHETGPGRFTPMLVPKGQRAAR